MSMQDDWAQMQQEAAEQQRAQAHAAMEAAEAQQHAAQVQQQVEAAAKAQQQVAAAQSAAAQAAHDDQLQAQQLHGSAGASYAPRVSTCVCRGGFMSRITITVGTVAFTSDSRLRATSILTATSRYSASAVRR